MSTFDDMFADIAIPVLGDQFGETVVYIDVDDAETNITGLVRRMEVDEEPSVHGRRYRETSSVTIARDSSSPMSGIASPKRGERLRIGSVEWTIERITDQTSSMVVLHLERTLSVEPSRPEYRRDL